MNQKRVGEFIAKNRKSKGLTQEQLAGILGVTNKSVSKWERGICLPDSSLYHSLCNVLDISVSELFDGERIKEKDNQSVNERLIDILTSRIYEENSGITLEEFRNALIRISQVTILLEGFETKKDAVEYLMKESECSFDECSAAYDFYTGLSKRTNL